MTPINLQINSPEDCEQIIYQNDSKAFLTTLDENVALICAKACIEAINNDGNVTAGIIIQQIVKHLTVEELVILATDNIGRLLQESMPQPNFQNHN